MGVPCCFSCDCRDSFRVRRIQSGQNSHEELYVLAWFWVSCCLHVAVQPIPGMRPCVSRSSMPYRPGLLSWKSLKHSEEFETGFTSEDVRINRTFTSHPITTPCLHLQTCLCDFSFSFFFLLCVGEDSLSAQAQPLDRLSSSSLPVKQ